ncbi:hypothetical protein Poly51_59640 [Rubripirellula tenax]|uniref:Uncharacterized protein n=1 Tax=Rubripirellula tenax TaxID=2528015 RepID=A0A5C6E854_9BACT|nr:hypothetical protein [Rubripirellula tenax]TWU44695.1 hypothetical protein Poly51_59640 [Rubripirellula tenax]
MTDNPYSPPRSAQERAIENAPAYSAAKVVLALIEVCVLLLLLAFASMSVYFAINPGALQSGNQPDPETFGSDDVPGLVVWCAIWLGLAAAIVMLTRHTWRLMTR